MSICKCGSRALNDDPERILCDCCWRDAEIDRLRAALDEVQTARRRGDEIVAGYEIEIQRLRAIVDKLPTTADGVTVVPGVDRAWWPKADKHTDHWQNGGRPGCDGFMPCWTYDPIEGSNCEERQIRVDECYSTREAAEKSSHGTTE